jgi:ribosome-associated toxin RatA of RatAB toxin-antitoxin module
MKIKSDKEVARLRVEALVLKFQTKYRCDWNWSDDASFIKFDVKKGAFKHMKGTFKVNEEKVIHVEIVLPFLLHPIKRILETQIKEFLGNCTVACALTDRKVMLPSVI